MTLATRWPWIVAVLVALCGFGGIISAVSGGSNDKPSRRYGDTAQATKAAAATIQAPPPALTTKAATQTLLTVSGKGIKKSAKFTTGSDWALAYTYDCKNFGGRGNFAVMLYTNGNLDDVLVNELDAKGADTVPAYKDGEHWLEINSECTWTVTVTG